MALFMLQTRNLLCVGKYLNAGFVTSRKIMSKTLYYSEFGDPLKVVKYKELPMMPLQPHEVLVRMLAAPVNPADINTIQGRNFILPRLPCVPGDEGVGDVVEIGDKVGAVDPGERVVLTTRCLGTWQYYGIYDERDVHVISPKIPLPEASMLAINPCTAYRMIRDFRKLEPGQTVVQNAANSPCGQSIIQLCKAWDINTFNIVANTCDYQSIKNHLLSIGATAVYSLEEAERLTKFDTSLERPVLALNCLGGKFEDVILKLLKHNGSVVYYGSAFDIPIAKHVFRSDVFFNRFSFSEWERRASVLEKDIMMNNITKLMVIGKFRAPLYQPIELKNFIHAFKNTAICEAFSTVNYIFDFTLP